jgi:hypothetical protein
MKSQRLTPAKIARKPSDAILANRYLELQRLRDEVRKAETSRARRGLRRPRDQEQLAS